MGSVVSSGIATLLVNFLGAAAVLRVTRGSLQVRFWLVLAVVSLLSSWVCSIVMAPETLLAWIGELVSYAVILIVVFRVIRPLTSSDLDWLSEAVPRLSGLIAYFSRPDNAGAGGDRK